MNENISLCDHTKGSLFMSLVHAVLCVCVFFLCCCVFFLCVFFFLGGGGGVWGFCCYISVSTLVLFRSY